MKKKWLAVAPLLALSSMAMAGNIADTRLALQDPCGAFEVIHINGVKTTVTGAQDNLGRIAAVYGNGHNNHVIKYRLAYNQTQEGIDDLAEVWMLKLREDPLLTFETFLRLTAGLAIPTAQQDLIFKSIAAMWNAASLAAVTATDPAVAAIALGIAGPGSGSPSLPHTTKKVIVAHSQGALFAVAVRDRLIQGINIAKPIPAESISMVSIGAASGSVKGPSASWSTSTNDMVIGALRTFTVPVGFTVLSNNITISHSSADWLGHNLIRIYLTATNGKNAVISKMKAALNAVKSPSPAPVGYVESVDYTQSCGVSSYSTPRACYIDIPYMAPYQWYYNPVTVNYYNTADVPNELHDFGQFSDLAAPALAYVEACYNAWIADKIDVIKTGLGQYEPWHVVEGGPGCGAGYPHVGIFNTSWWVSSGDGTKIVTKEVAGTNGYRFLYTQKHLTCRVAAN